MHLKLILHLFSFFFFDNQVRLHSKQHPRGNQLTKTTKTKTKSRAQPEQHLTTLTTRREQKYTNQPGDKEKKLTVQIGKA